MTQFSQSGEISRKTWSGGVRWASVSIGGRREPVATRTRLINPRDLQRCLALARLVTITKHLLCTRRFHLFLLRGPRRIYRNYQPISPVSLLRRARASSHSPAAIRKSAALTATLAAPCRLAILLHLRRHRHPSSFVSSRPSSASVRSSLRRSSFLPPPPSVSSFSSFSSSPSAASSRLSRRVDHMPPHTGSGFFRKKPSCASLLWGSAGWARAFSVRETQLARL